MHYKLVQKPQYFAVLTISITSKLRLVVRSILFYYIVNMKKVYRISIFILLIACCTTCVDWEDEPGLRFPEGDVEGYRPVYAEDLNTEISYREKSPLINPGKIYSYKNFLLIVDSGYGIHVYDNTHRENPEQIGMLRISGNQDIAMKGNYIFADQFGDLVVIDITDIKSPNVVVRHENVAVQRLRPPSGYFYECVDPTREHMLIGWELDTINQPQCFQ
jgi:hypothetical protein